LNLDAHFNLVFFHFPRLSDLFLDLSLGLTISRSIIEAHGGRLRAKENAPRGAVFEFTLPIRDATHP
jgi:K+-sensing histidine kinase KdpD